MKFKLTKGEKNWILYDVGNSAFVLLVSTIMPIYFNYLAQKEGLSSVQYMSYWGYAASIATLLVAILGPVFGTLADTKGYKKPIFAASIVLGAVACIGLGFAVQWLVFLVVFLFAKVGFSGSLIFYDSMLSDVTVEERMDYVSSQGYAWGYIGSCIPFIACLALVLEADSFVLTMETAMQIAFLIIAVWWLTLSTPLFRTYQQKNYVERKPHAVRESFRRIGLTMKNVRKDRKVFFFLLAFFFYIDGVYTIIDMATAYGSALGLDSTGLLLALLVTQFVAFPCAIAFGRLTQKIDAEKLIGICIVAYFAIAVFAMFLSTQIEFWALAVMVGMFQGGIQALSRSYYTKIIPANQSGEYFGILDICGKGAAFMGTTLVSVVSQITGNVNLGVGMIGILFILGMIFFQIATKTEVSEQPVLESVE